MSRVRWVRLSHASANPFVVNYLACLKRGKWLTPNFPRDPTDAEGRNGMVTTCHSARREGSMARTILVADDNPLMRKMLCEIF
jgi:hypothetical protein